MRYQADPRVDDYIDALPGWQQDICQQVRDLVHGADPDVTETGVAVARSEKTGYYYGVQMFGRPKSAAVVFKVENRAGVVALGRTDYSETQ